MKKYLLLTFVCICSAHAEIYSGEGCAETENDVCLWSYDTSTGLLHISGSGNMKNFVGKTGERPWQGFKDQISKVVIDEGITGIGGDSFIQDGSIDFFDSKKDPVMKKNKDGNIIELCATNPDKSISCFNDKQKLTRKLHAKIYTVEEAMAVTREGNVNRVRLTYK